MYVYVHGVANITIYLDDSLKERVKAAELPISRICQAALRAELDAAGMSDALRLVSGQMSIDDYLADK